MKTRAEKKKIQRRRRKKTVGGLVTAALHFFSPRNLTFRIEKPRMHCGLVFILFMGILLAAKALKNGKSGMYNPLYQKKKPLSGL